MMAAHDAATCPICARARHLVAAAPAPDPATLDRVYDLLAPDDDDALNHPDTMFSRDVNRAGHAPDGTTQQVRKGTTGSGVGAMERAPSPSTGADGASGAPTDPAHRAVAP